MGKQKKVDSKEAGLEIGLHFFKFFLKTEYLHYGYFKNLETDISNLAKAQEQYANYLLSSIPEDVKTILDVGCGSGKMAETLLEKGYKVDAVAPGNLLSNYVKEKIGDRIELFNCRFQDLVTSKKYDMVMFSESFQYIHIKDAMEGAINFTREGGYIMIADFFKTDAPGKSMLGGGHKYSEWLEVKPNFKLETIKEEDITEETAPTIDLVSQLSTEVLQPIWRVVFALAEDRFPLILKFVKWKYKKKLAKLDDKHFSGQRNGKNFKIYKKYMFYLFKKQ
ncbi:MAG: class I SAM-dependent methyltransferase [Bacteroidales bacterium]|nr:class I SAM-dependent methyltransferase [Bacteroidales bacterium]